MAGRQDWTEVVELVKAAGDPSTSRHLPRLWALAEAEAVRALGSLNRRIGDATARDLVADLLVERLSAIVDADQPRAYFIVAIRNRARSWLRRAGSREVSADDPKRPESIDNRAAAIDDRGFVLDARAALARLSSRDRDIVIAAGLGIDREELAGAFGTSRANVDQIVSRTQRRFREDGR